MPLSCNCFLYTHIIKNSTWSVLHYSSDSSMMYKKPLHVLLEKLLVVLRDGRTLIGFLRSIDQFGTIGIFA